MKMQHAVRDSAQNGVCFAEKWLKLPDLNVGVVQSVPGFFKLGHLVLGLVCLALISHSCQFVHPLSGNSLGFFCSNPAAFFLLVTYGCFVTSLILLISFLFSYFTSSFLPKTVFEFIYHGISSAMYLIASLILLITIIKDNEGKDPFKEPGYGAKIVASVFGLINSVLYGASTFFSVQSRRELGQNT